MLFTQFTEYEKEALRLAELGLVHPSYDYILKCSHTFNLLDARGAVSATERPEFLKRIRNMAKSVASSFVRERYNLSFPLLPEKDKQKWLDKYSEKEEA